MENNSTKSVLVTGAFGGMGRAATEMLAKRGFRVFALDRSVSDAPEGVVPIAADLTSEGDIERAYEAVASATGELFAIIHFAGIYMLNSLVEMPKEDFERIFEINLFSAAAVNRRFMPLLSSGSRIVITTSELAVLDPLPFTGIYAVTKAALDKYAYSLRMELQLLGISVSVLRAGAVDTGMLGASTDALDRFCNSTRIYTCNAEKFKDIVNKVEARCVKPSVIADKVFAIISARKPKFAYAVNRNPLLLLLNMLPQRLQLYVIGRILRK